MSANPVGNAATNLSLLRYLTTPFSTAPCADCAGDDPDEMCTDHQQEFWCDVLADRAEASRDEAR